MNQNLEPTKIHDLVVADADARESNEQINRKPEDTPKIWDLVERGSRKELEAAIKEGVDLNCKDALDETPLHKAMRNNRILHVFMLLRSGANPEMRNASGQTPLEVAMENKNRILVWAIFRKAGKTASRTSRYRRTIEHAKGGLPARRLPHGSRSLRIAAMRGDEKHCELLLNAGVSVNEKGDHGETPLHLAAMCGNQKVIAMLLKEGANPCAKDNGGRTPSQYAQIANKTPVAKFLLDKEEEHKGRRPETKKPGPVAEETPAPVQNISPL